MNTVKISVNPQKSSQKMRNIFGMVNSPEIKEIEQNLNAQREFYKELNPAYVRHHDPALCNPGKALVNISEIFPLFHLDHNDPKNYIFKPTDDYLRIAAENGARIEFRLGEDIDHSGVDKYKIKLPTDYEKWAEICVNILKHYKEGWANGLYLDVFAASIWEEPDNPKLLAGDFDKFLDLFAVAGKKIKEAFPDMLVGGPNVMACNLNTEFYERLVSRCEKHGFVPDFISGTVYYRNIKDIVDIVEEADGYLKKRGLSDTKFVISEWNLGPYEWIDGYCDPVINGFATAMKAAFCTSSMIRLMDTPLAALYYYEWGINACWGLFVKDGIGYRLLPVYYGLKYYSDTVNLPKRLDCNVSVETDKIDVLSGMDESGNVKLLVSCYEFEAAKFEFSVPGYTKCAVKTVSDNSDDNSPCEVKMLDCDANGSVFLDMKEANGIFMLEFSK